MDREEFFIPFLSARCLHAQSSSSPTYSADISIFSLYCSPARLRYSFNASGGYTLHPVSSATSRDMRKHCRIVRPAKSYTVKKMLAMIQEIRRTRKAGMKGC